MGAESERVTSLLTYNEVLKVHTFNLPRLVTCPGASAVCRRICYGGMCAFQVHAERHAANLRRLMVPGGIGSFVEEMTREIQLGRVRERVVRVVRIHAVGDFWSAEYTGGWRAVAEACPDVRFFCFTRSWSCGGRLLDELIAPESRNLRIWFSWDPSMPNAPRGARVARIAGLGGGAVTCRKQTEGIACRDCGMCFRDGARQVVFRLH